jgi:hypothetical protein
MGVSPSNRDESYFAYSATLRVHGTKLPLEEIAATLGVHPTYQHKAGDRPRASAPPYREDAWHFTAPIARETELTEHLRSLWRTVEPHVDYLAKLNAIVDVFCGYRSNDGTGGFAIEPDALQIFKALDVPFGVSIIIDSWLGDALPEPVKH